MRQIKFRGRDLSGKMRYGFYAESAGFPYIIENCTWYEVQSDTVAQLVGYDGNGKEVYEGDIVEGVDEEWVAVLVSDILHNREDIREAPLKYLTLKEQPS